MERQQLTLIKVKIKIQLTDKEYIVNSWITKLAFKYKEVEKIYDPVNTVIFSNVVGK